MVGLWNERVEVGNAEVAAPAAEVKVPSDTERILIRSFVTGHGQGNVDNCAEFCKKDHTVFVDSTGYDREIWRDDCGETKVQPQAGLFWDESRAGWCPGDIVKPWRLNISDSAEPGDTLSMGYGLEGYINTCRPGGDVPPGSGVCAGCVLVPLQCTYDGGLHTTPRFEVSTAIIFYR